MKSLIIILSALVLNGCAQYIQAMERAYTSSIDLAKADCREMGFRPGTSQYDNCVLQITQNIRDNRARSQSQNKTVTCEKWGINQIRCTER